MCKGVADASVDWHPKESGHPVSITVLIVNLAILFAVLESDLGRRTVSKLRILRPLFLAAGIVPMFIESPATSGSGAVLEVSLAALGVLFGVAAAGGLMQVDFDAQKHRVVSTAGVAYAAFWSIVIGARLAFTYGANHWYTSPLVHWLHTNGISAAALTDALIFMAVTMTVARTLRLAGGRFHLQHLHAGELALQA
jgi:hypothetical protein